jgi:TonB family protein
MTFTQVFVLVLAVLQTWAASGTFALLRTEARLAPIQSPPPQTTSFGFEILTDAGGADFTGWATHMGIEIKRNWYGRMPESAQLGDKGKVVLRFQVQRDGKLLNQELKVELSSGKKALDKAAIGAIRDAVPFESFPEKFAGPAIELRLTFVYNWPQPSAQRPKTS